MRGSTCNVDVALFYSYGMLWAPHVVDYTLDIPFLCIKGSSVSICIDRGLLCAFFLFRRKVTVLCVFLQSRVDEVIADTGVEGWL